MIPQHPFRKLVLIHLAILCLGGTVSSIQAQPINPYRARYLNIPSPYWGYTYNPYGDYLHGAADVIRSQGQYLVNKEQAGLVREKARQEKFVTRKKEVELWAWEREFKIEVWEKERERIRQKEIERDRTDPPQTQVWDASSLNLLLAELKKLPLSPGNSERVKPEWLPHVHVTYARSGTGGNVGLLKGEHVVWPLLLRTENFTREREEIEKLLAQAKQETLNGTAKVETLVDMRGLVDELERHVREESRSNPTGLWSPSDFIRARQTLRELRSALQMLEREDAKSYLQPLQGETIAQLVQYMRDRGLSFAPATSGGERSYTALHGALAREYTRVKSQYPR